MAVSENGGQFVRVVSLLIFSAAFGGCSSNSSTSNTMNVDENLTTTDMNATSAETAPPPKVHNYQEKDGTTYEYVSAVSEEDAKKGKAVGDVLLYAFRGVFDGRYRISAVDNDGRSEWYYECSNPCGVIKQYRQGHVVDRVPYNPASVIGAAFEDAFNGFLEISKEPKTLPDTYAAPVAPIYASPAAPPTPEPQGPDEDNNGF
jgi:hypothetical protein